MFLGERYAVQPVKLRTVPPLVTAHTFWASRVWSEIFGFLNQMPTATTAFLHSYDDVEKADLTKTCWNLKEKCAGVTTHFSEIIKQPLF